MKTPSRLRDAAGVAGRIGRTLDELERQLVLRREEDRDPLSLFLADRETFEQPEQPITSRRRVLHRINRVAARRFGERDPLAEWVSPRGPQTTRATFRRSWERTARRARLAAAPVALSLALATFALVRLPSANTLWYEELTITSDVTTLESFCEPPLLSFVEATTTNGQTTYVYALSGDGDGVGPGCLPKDISNIFIEVCFNPELAYEDDKGRVVETTEPADWEYSPKAAGNPKQVKWDWDSFAPNKGPWDPEVHLFSFTLDVDTDDFGPSTAFYKAGQETVELGEVQVPLCPLPEAPEDAKLAGPEPSLSILAEPEADVVVEEVEDPEPEPIVEEPEEVEPLTDGPMMILPEDGKKKPTPAPTATPVAISRPAPR